ncbi:SPW repeat protein [Alicyclobacillus sp.]|uniref:SPW repeat protein n=1 Tax=Alicyclobacillus sp. TaxID=61169 RepID=UPI0025BD9511|nr:SPW repeat protein [Alicyclobacillus sp.]MCL6516252.1 SPW repeat protein [Alicyclobacillus sp.]
MKWRNWLNAIIGVWFIIAPWVLGVSDVAGAVWTSVIFGAIQVIASVWAAYVEEPSWRTWQNWVSFLTGVWFILQPFVLPLSGNAGETWTSVILGIVTAVLNLWTMWEGANGHSTGGKANA